ncbi:methyl-accepting chemotaxis protein [Aquipseudomonas ullengensis]|uniref:Methyl-accepting chemotaxis protein n=1 Tax=Aquipseudomonas ullengensis TaxID=2759166 RepID=A0A7W4LNE4_9GAMM|nr:methyl-accepting chemotaxis protein [Pseudomonas ullengensis]MBB2496265.1 methyl-accepting chemotaxis protein [Pseudomonas ullengensis]
MLQLLRTNARRAENEEALSALFNQHDLTTRLPEQQAWMGRLNRFSDGLHQRIRTSLGAAVGIASHAPQLADIASANQESGQSLAQSSELIASASEQVTTTLDVELVPGAAEVARLSGEVASTLRQCQQSGQDVLNQVEAIGACEAELGKVIGNLAGQLEEVSKVIGVIASISQQTNLLALNAAIEAARAGEHGRGFAVVAEEVRRLAGHTTESTGQVSQIIERFRDGMAQLGSAGERMHQAVEDGRDGMLQVGAGLDSTRQAMDMLDERVSHIATGTEQIGQAVRSINGDVQQIAQVAGDLLGKAGQVLRHSQAVREDGDRLLQGLGDFRLELHRAVQSGVEQLARQSALSGDLLGAERLLSETLRRDARFELFYLVDNNGVQLSENIFASDVPHQEAASCRGRNWSQRPWFRAVADGLRSHITPVYRSSATDDFCFTVSVPILGQDGRLQRVLGADVRLSVLV